jgi:heat-inducible transcriptional repressor
MNSAPGGIVSELNERSRAIFREIVDEFVTTGEPIGSRTLSRRLSTPLSPATIRNVMSDLEEMGLLYAPHTSAGRLPTEIGLRLYVDGLLEIGELSHEEQETIESQCAARGKSMNEALEGATAVMSGLAGCAGVVAAPKTDRPLKHVEFVNLGDGQALVVLVNGDGLVENRIINVPIGTPPSALVEAGNYLNARLIGRTLDQARSEILSEIADRRARLDQLTSNLVETGLATWAGDLSEGSLIVKGQSTLLNDIEALGDLERVRGLFEALERQELLIGLLELTGDADGVQIFIGSENTLFSHTGCTMIVAPFTGSQSKIVGAIGVIGPTRINYARIIPIVDYTAKVVGRLIG